MMKDIEGAHEGARVTKKKYLQEDKSAMNNDPQTVYHDKQYRQIFDHSNIIIFSHDINGKITTINPAAIRTLEYSYEELLGLTIQELIPENVRPEFYETYLPKITKDRNANGVMQILNSKGIKKFWLYQNHYFEDIEEQPFILGFALDITDRMEIEDLLKIGNETFRSVFDFSGIGMLLVSPKGKIIDANNAFTKFIGYSKNELLRLNFLDLSLKEDNDMDLMLLNRILNKLINFYSIEKRYVSKNKKILWALHTVSKVSDKNGAPAFFILQIVDITKKKQLADDLNRKNSELEAIRADLVNKIQQQEKLNYIIAHNLRGSAGNIKMLVNMLTDATNSETSSLDEIKEVISYLDEGSNALLSTLNSLMDVVQINLNRSIPYDDCDVPKIIIEILGQLNSIIYEKGVHVPLKLDVTTISYPKVFLESIFYNLISNAIKYSSPNRKPEITISTYRFDDRIHISVKDNGIGIDLEKHSDKIFKLNQVINPGKDSMGVGLFITKAQIESFGGSISVKSVANEGTEFIVTL